MNAERNTPRDIVFDLEDDIGDLRRLGSTLRLVADTHGLEDVVQDGLHQVARGLSDCHRDLHDKFKRLFDQIVRADIDKPVPPKPVQPTAGEVAGRTVYQLCHEWDVVKAKLDLDLLQSTGDDKENDRILDEARAQFRAIERAILATDPDTMGDVDLVVVLRHARKVIGDDQFIPEQEQRCHEMLDLLDSALVRRTGGADWNMEARS